MKLKGKFSLIIIAYVTLNISLHISYKVFWRSSSPTSSSHVTSSSHPTSSSRPTSSVSVVKDVCRHIPLSLWPSHLEHQVQHYSKYPCHRQEDWVYVRNGTFQIHSDMIRKHGSINCSYKPLLRGRDDNSELLGAKIAVMKNGSRIPVDFFEAECHAADGTSSNEFHAGVSVKEKIKARAKLNILPKDALGMNILMFGFDSVSHMNWLRALPESTKYYINTLEGIVLDGYNIVGDGTPAALLPILTGQTEEELPEARRGKPNAKPVDEHPWIWNKFKDAGYITQWGEDVPSVGTFNYRMLGFRNQPVDYYLRPFYRMVEKDRSRRRNCVGAKYGHVMMMDWIKELYTVYPDTPKFSFLFHSELSHDIPLGRLKNADIDLLDFLQYMHKSGHLDNTLLILMADHGQRYQAIRRSYQGKFEERLPFFSFRFPPTFAKKYPRIVQNMRTNINRLTTPFDIHETLLNVLHFNASDPGNRYKRGVSLLHEVPENRTCASADIAAHWCTCLGWTYISVNDSSVHGAAMAFINTVNNLTSKERDMCAILDLHNIFHAKRYSPTNDLVKFKRSLDNGGRIPDLSANTFVTVVLFQLTLETTPGHGQYEVTVTQYQTAGSYAVNIREISRINRYGNQPHCVQDELPHLRPYCYCKEQLPTISDIGG